MLKNKQPNAVSIRATMQQQHMASARNRRLAQQMENRPSVQAALNHKQVRAKIGCAEWHRVAFKHNWPASSASIQLSCHVGAYEPRVVFEARHN